LIQNFVVIGRFIGQILVWALLIVSVRPHLNLFVEFGDVTKPFQIQTFRSQRFIEPFDQSVLAGLARLDISVILTPISVILTPPVERG
jgi:hypothetical protein